MAYGATSMGIRVINAEDAAPEAKPVEIATYSARNLRTALNFPSGDKYRVKLLHMHGSLTYWESTSSDVRVKVPIEALRLHDLWEGLRTSSPGWRPSVVLANSLDKAKHVKAPPFDVAYEAFRAGLGEAEHWLIIGYSFRDQCVNEELRKEFSRRSQKPAVLVCTYGDDLKLEDIHRAFGWGAEDGSSWGWLSVNRQGAVGLEASFEWSMFTYEPEG